MKFGVTNLPWLAPAPADFKERCTAIAADPEPGGMMLRQLATHGLDNNQLTRLYKALPSRGIEDSLKPLRLAILSNGTADFLKPALTATGLRHGLALDVTEVPFAQVAQQVFDPGSGLYRARPDVVLLALDQRGLPLHQGANAALSYLKELSEAISKTCGATVIVQSLAPIPEPLFGNFDALYEFSEIAQTTAFNHCLVELVRREQIFLLDVAQLAATVGLDHWHDPVLWYLAKLPFSQNALPLYADYVGRLLGALVGLARRCLVLDLDNTIWGGVIGDDGLDGIILGQGDPAGEAFLAVQQMALALKERGIILAVCSKNEDDTARQPFRKHPEMLIKEGHITVFQANWEDKASNIEAIAKSINIGLDSLVFLDDNPAERAQVRAALPMVAVPELPLDPAYYPRMLLSAGYFDAVSFSEEDRARVSLYHADAKRLQVKTKTRDLGEYLASLDMTLTVKPCDGASRSRVTQLINKSNQFNLTTRRYTEVQVKAFERDDAIRTFQARLRDSFGDNGIISVAICRAAGEDWEIDTWLMSCRVLGRRVEEGLLNTIVAAAKVGGAKRLVGRYIPTRRNNLVKDHFSKLGFASAGEDQDGASLWRLDLPSFVPKIVPMVIES